MDKSKKANRTPERVVTKSYNKTPEKAVESSKDIKTPPQKTVKIREQLNKTIDMHKPREKTKSNVEKGVGST